MAPDLAEIAAGRIRPAVVASWRAAEFRRHLILIEALRREVLPSGPEPGFADAHRSLAETQRTDADRVFRVLSAPQAGVWAARSLRSPGSADLGYLRRLAGRLTGEPAAPSLRVHHDGLTLDLDLGLDDPYLDLYGERDGAPDLARWHQAIHGGWRLIGTHERDLAAAMAETLRVLVPLPTPVSGRLRSATSGWAFGAIAMSQPADAVECAETLVHEFRHVLLGAITNHLTLVRDGAWKGRAPWRTDLRPAEGLLQGCFAYAGLIALWRRLLGTEHHDHATASLATWHGAALEAVDELAASGTLTRLGEEFVAELRGSL